MKIGAKFFQQHELIAQSALQKEAGWSRTVRNSFLLNCISQSVIVVAGACGLAVGTPIALLATNGKLSRRGDLHLLGKYRPQTIAYDMHA